MTTTKTVGTAEMRRAGRSWTEIAQRLGISVAEAKALAAPVKAERRAALAHTESNERRRGLLATCWNGECKHARKDHGDDGCVACGPEHEVFQATIREAGQYRNEIYPIEGGRPVRPAETNDYDWYVYRTWIGCDNFLPEAPSAARQRLLQEAQGRTGYGIPVFNADETKVILVPAHIGSGGGWRHVPQVAQIARLSTRMRRARRRMARASR